MNSRTRAVMVLVVLTLGACGDEAPPPPADLGGSDTGGYDLGVDPSTDAAVECTADSQCDDGVFCNGTGRCLPGMAGTDARGCIVASAGASPCSSGETCNEAMRLCQSACDTASDADGDGVSSVACGGDDCDDDDARSYPGNLEVCDAAGHDEDCNAATLGPDVDADSFVSTGCCNVQAGGALSCGDDCNDTVGGSTVHPGAVESCNLVDEDCDGTADEGVQVGCYADIDGDSYAALGAAEARMCSCGAGFTATPPATAADCDDTCTPCHLGATEVCDARDNDCDGMTDENLGAACTVGMGACTSIGQLRCDGTCSATAGVPDTTYHTTVAPNGSWDWNCDGMIEPTASITDSYTSAFAFCMSQTCFDGSYSGGLHIGPTTPGGMSPYCGAYLWMVSSCMGPPFPSPGPCTMGGGGTYQQTCR